jgi:hypothetical protein
MADVADSTGSGDAATLWVEHLRAGGTTPWPGWVRQSGAAPASAPATVPGAAQLELLRRVNELGPLPHRVEHVLDRPGPGRGSGHLRLPTDPVGPAAPRREVLRVASGVLADLVVQLPSGDGGAGGPGSTPGSQRTRRSGRPRPVRGVPTFVLDGLPLTVAEVRAALREVGILEHRPGRSWWGRSPGRSQGDPQIAVVLAGQLDTALHEAWAGRVQRGTARAWPRFVAQWAGRRQLPASAAVDATVSYWAERADQVHLVVIDDDTDPLVEVLDLLGQSSLEPHGPGQARDGPVRLPPATLDALRRVNGVLPFVCPPDDQPLRRTALLELVRGDTGPAVPADLPEGRRAWAVGAAGRLADALAASGCVVHGDLGVLRTIPAPAGRRVGGEEVLDAMVRMIHRVDAALLGESRDGRGGR